MGGWTRVAYVNMSQSGATCPLKSFSLHGHACQASYTRRQPAAVSYESKLPETANTYDKQITS